MTAFTLRINREISVASSGDITWLPVADWFNILSLSVMLVGVFTLPALDVVDSGTAARLFGLAALLLLGYAFALVGHYEMYKPGPRSMRFFPTQERVVTMLVGIAAVGYVAAAFSL